MALSRNKLYASIFIACLAGYLWLFYGLSRESAENKPTEVCMIKHLTNVPCPSCGSTRSVLSISKGDFIEAAAINPLGYVVAIIMLLAPVWIALDMASKRKTLFDHFHKAETCLKRPMIAIPLILLVFINWIWNISKGL